MDKLPIGQKIKIVRVAQGLHQSMIEARTGLDRVTISNLETGRYLPTPNHIAALEAAFGLRFDDPQVEAALLLLAGVDMGEQCAQG